ncbi:MAG: T9SS type A sorting domain-containing protein [Ferruginibacter sp.]
MIKQFIKASLMILWLLNWSTAFAQKEFLVTIDPITGIHTKIDSIPGVTYIQTAPSSTTFNETDHQYIFKGNDHSGQWDLYSIDATTAAIVSNPHFPIVATPSDNVIELQYDNSSNILYGVHWDNTEGREYFISIDPSSGLFTKIDSLPGVRYITILPGFTTYNKNNHQYIFKGEDINGNKYLYTIDAATGSIISSPAFPVVSDPFDNVIELQIDNSTNKLYGLHWDYSESREYLVLIDNTTGSFTKIDSLPGVRSIAVTPHYTTFDAINHRFIFKGSDAMGQGRLYSVDVTTGSIVSSPLFPVLTDILDNVIELQFDNATGTLYGLHWDATLPVLPVTLSDFNATLKGQDVLCEWKTLQEQNSSHFIIERSNDAVHFNSIGKLAMAGNTVLPVDYHFTDENAWLTGKDYLYYRLKMVDMDGSFKYSNTANVKLKYATAISIYPNPAVDKINISFMSYFNEQASITILDEAGIKRYQQSISIVKGNNSRELNIHALPAGNYIILVNAKNKYTGRFIKAGE